MLGEEPSAPPRTTAIGALGYYVSHADPRNYQPTNITFGIMPAPPSDAVSAFRRAKTKKADRKPTKRADRKAATAERALAALEDWLGERAAPILP